MSDTIDQLNKWALLIGVEEYPYMPGVRSSGSVNDVRMMSDILQKTFGIPSQNIVLLQDEMATRDTILNSMDNLLSNVKEYDSVVFYYSGQGSQMPDTEKKWPNSLVSTIATYDTGFDSDISRQITYDEIYDWLVKLNAVTSNVALIIDAGHSGTITPIVNSNSDLSFKRDYVFLGACSSDQVAFEYNTENMDYGAFTYALSYALIEAKPLATYRDVIEKASAWLIERSLPRPQIEGSSDRVLFGAGKIKTKHFVTIDSRAIDRVTLGAGAVHGLTAKSRWTVHGVGSCSISNENPMLGLVEITQVGVSKSEARILSEVDNKEGISPGAMACEESHYYGDMRLSVEVKDTANLGTTAEYLKELIRESLLLHLAEPNEKTDVTAMILAPREGAKESDPVPQLMSLFEPTWVLVDESGSILMTSSAVNSEAVWEIRDNLERKARYRNIRDLKNPNANSRLLGKVDFNLKWKDTGKLIVAGPEGGLPILREGDRFVIEAANYYHEPLYVAIFDFAPDGSFALVHPKNSGCDELKPGNIGNKLSLDAEIYLPKDGPTFKDRQVDLSMADANDSVIGVETAKLFATTSRTDFADLIRQGSNRGIGGDCGQNKALWELLDMALTGYGKRDPKPVNMLPEQEWTTVERPFLCGKRINGGDHA
jgi:hypothetical protein